jgi:prepilin-type N-terminal cleavage/methylation domain-containing protein
MQSFLRREQGFTLIELTVVVVIIGLTMALTMPRFRYSLLSDNLKASTRRLATLITSLSKESVQEHKDYLLFFDLSGNWYWTENPGMTEEGRLIAREQAVSLPGGVRLLDIKKKGDEIRTTGEIPIMITKKGYIQPATIHLGSDSGRVFTLYLKTFAGKAEILEGYVELEE